MVHSRISLVLLFTAASALAQSWDSDAQPKPFPLWEGKAPGALGDEDRDRPTLTYYPAISRSAVTVIVAPGGGYGALAMNHEGRQIANWFNAQGISAFVLKYRLGPRYHHPIELGDAKRAVRMVRARAQEYGIDPHLIGFMGFSAGGHLTSTIATHFDAGDASAADLVDRFSSRPDFAILCYPVVSSDPAVSHKGSFRNLLGDNPDPEQLKDMSNELHVTKDTPPSFLFHTSDDPVVPVLNSVRFYEALVAAHVPAELHIFQHGPHGVGLDLGDPVLAEWPVLLRNWLRFNGLMQ
jgi:acetyl esterase/lipase